ncbi:uncharacterized protein LOC115229916 [Octopus sinensis]|uniref:Uncharacterized protein LOC115229916 n=1 Tax=Octopus sinensis TaxID=2607531 RepID=A0A6P7TUR0_9MOLL|nr:uncharacterized protein LOC115229916 [Octopus sinensis]XP_036355296.1 uncharacterized protein LOC115229916 [Octopus sinensis]
MSLTIPERVELIFLSGRDGATNRTVAETFNQKHPGKAVSHTTVGRLVQKFRATGSVHDKLRSGRPVISNETRVSVINELQKSPKKSVRRLSQEIGVPRTTMRRIIKAAEVCKLATSHLKSHEFPPISLPYDVEHLEGCMRAADPEDLTTKAEVPAADSQPE